MSELKSPWPLTAGPISEKTIEELPVAYTEVDAEGVLRVANAAACRIFDMPVEELLGHSVWEFVPADEAVRDRAEFLAAIAAGEDLPVIRRSLYNSRGEYRVHELHRNLLRGADGRPVGISCATFDVSQLESAHQESIYANRWLESVFEAIPQAVVVTDALGFVRHVNPAAELLIGWTASDLVGKQIEKGMPILKAVPQNKGHAPLSFRIALHDTWNGNVELLDRNRQTLAVWLSASPILDKESGHTNGVVIVLRAPRSLDSGPAVSTDGELPVPAGQPAV